MTKHLQKFTAVLLAAIMTLGVFTVVPFTASAATSGDFEYEILDDGTAKITGYTGTAAELTLPSELDGHKVTYFGSAWTFSGCTSLTSITFPDSASSIVETSLSSIENLTSITVNSNNANYSSINGVLFNKNKTELIIYPRGKTDENYTIPDSVQSISNHAFNGCTNLTSITVNSNNANYSSVDGVLFNKNKTELIIYPRGKTDENYTIPDSVTSIGYYAFQDCTNLKNIVVPNDITSIGAYAFWGCAGLKSITISDSVTSIGYRAFMDCENLASIIIPDSVTSIGDFAFDGCENLTSITIPNSVTSIGNYAFEGCTNLASITIPDSVIIGIEYSSLDSTAWFDNQPDGIVYAGKVAYKYKGEMPENTSLTIKDGTKSIGYRAFSSCYNLTSITIPDSVTSIGDDAFSSCYNLTSITIPDSVTSIGEWTFRECTGLTSITIPDSVTSINERAFDGCTRLTSITVNNSNANYSSVDGVLFNKNKTELIKYLEGKTDENYTIPDSVTSIGKWAFASCRRIKSLTIPTSVTSIGEWAFNNCGINSITIPASVTSIYGTDLGFFDGVILVDTLTITGYKGTAAEKYANEYGFKFIALDDSANPTNPTEPTESTEPTVPTVPNQPTVPTVPTVPTEPTEPTNPIQPTEPNNPDDPANPTPDNTSKPSLGDIDGDGEISVNDVTDIQKYIVQIKPFTDEQMKFADVDKNGKIDVNDVTLLQKVIVKIAVI